MRPENVGAGVALAILLGCLIVLVCLLANAQQRHDFCGIGRAAYLEQR